MSRGVVPLSAPEARAALRAGLVAMLPIAIGVIPFGLIYGVTAADIGLGAPLAIAMSSIIFAGAAQLAAVQLLGEGAALLVIILTGLVINARHLMYSASIEPHFRPLTGRWKALLAYLLTDQAYAVSITRFESETDNLKPWYYLGGAVSLWMVWHVTTVIGFAVGAEVPESWSLDFAVPLVFLALMITAIKDRSTLAAASGAGFVTIAASGLPLNLGLIVGSLAGIVTGVVVARGTG